MPRKNVRPAAKKAAPRRHAPPQDMAMHGAAIAVLAASTARTFDMLRDTEIDRIIEDNLDDLYES